MAPLLDLIRGAISRSLAWELHNRIQASVRDFWMYALEGQTAVVQDVSPPSLLPIKY